MARNFLCIALPIKSFGSCVLMVLIGNGNVPQVIRIKFCIGLSSISNRYGVASCNLDHYHKPAGNIKHQLSQLSISTDASARTDADFRVAVSSRLVSFIFSLNGSPLIQLDCFKLFSTEDHNEIQPFCFCGHSLLPDTSPKCKVKCNTPTNL